MKKKMVLKKVLSAVCMIVVIGGLLFASQTAGHKLIAMRSPSGFVSLTTLK